jgi:dipeptidase D
VSGILADLEPRGIWTHFLALTRIPRPPKQEEEARAHVLAWAAERGFEAEVDEEGNAVVRVPASEGREGVPTVVLQSHLDMVCEREPESPNDPREGRIEVVRDDDWVLARDTTLGADNGIGVAAAMAVADDPDVEHGPLELLFTVSEEQGLEGAKALDPSLVRGRLLVNLDGTSNAALTVGCAGSAHTFLRLPLHPEAVPSGWLAPKVTVSGARGGHSGADIAKGRLNAIKALGRVLSGAELAGRLRLVSLDGGVSRNAIPREAHALVAVEPGAAKAVREAIADEIAALRAQHRGTDDEVTATVEPTESVEQAAGEETTRRALDLLQVLPTGVISMSPQVRGVVETSTSVTVASTDEGMLTLASMTRSAVPEALDDVVAGIESAARLAGAEVEIVRSYPPWRPDFDSSLLARAKGTHERLFASEPRLEVVHGGLECAVIGERLPGVEMISLGPDLEGPHAPGERLSVSGTAQFYRLLAALLDDLSAAP